MRASLAAPLALISIGLLAAVPVSADVAGVSTTAPLGLPASTTGCPLPVSVTGIFDKTAAAAGQAHQHWAVPGDTVEIDGAGFRQTGCSVTVTVGDAVPIAVPSSAISTAGNSLTLAAPALNAQSTKGLNGPVSVQLHDSLSNVAGSANNYHFLEQPSASLQQASPAEGSNDTLAGFGFNSGGDSLSVIGTYTGCPGPGSVIEAGIVSSDTSASLPVPTTYCDGAVQVSVTDPHYDSTAKAPDDSPIMVSAPVGSADVAALVSSVSPRTASPGDFITVVGSGFGPTGSARVGSTTVPAGWSDHEILVQAPSATLTGALILTRATGDHASFSAGSIMIAPGQPGSGPGPGGWTYPTVTGGITPAYPTNLSPSAGFNLPMPFSFAHGAVSAIHAGGPMNIGAPQNPQDQLTISSANRQSQVSSDLEIVVTLIVQGKPVIGAPISLSLVSAPGTDAGLKPSTGFSDGKGKFHSTLHLSRLAGDHLLLARSGQYSDEVHVLGQTEAAGASIKLPFGNINISGNPLVVWLSVACFALILLGVLVNINVMRRFVWSVSGGRVFRWLHRRISPSTPAS